VVTEPMPLLREKLSDLRDLAIIIVFLNVYSEQQMNSVYSLSAGNISSVIG